MNNAYRKDIFRTIRKNGRRFFAIIVITALGLTAFCGIYAAVRDLYMGADHFYDEQRLFDIQAMSTMGLTDDDVKSLQSVSGVDVADGGYSEVVRVTVADARQTAEIQMVSPKGLNTPYVQQGRLPNAAGEIAVTQEYLDASGQSVGGVVVIEEETEEKEPEQPDDKPNEKEDETGIDWDADIEIEEDAETPTFLSTRFTITGIVANPMNIASNSGGQSARSAGDADYTFFVTPADIDSDYYTSIYLTLHGLRELDCYDEEYTAHVQAVIDYIEAQVMEQRERARYNDIIAEATGKIAAAEDTMNEKFAEADSEFADAWAEIESAKQEITDGEAELTQGEKDALQQLADARAGLDDGKAQLDAAEADIAAGEAALNENAETLAAGKRTLEQEKQTATDGFAAAETAFDTKQKELDGARGGLSPVIDGLKAPFGELWPAAEWDALTAAAAAKTAELTAVDITAAPDPAKISEATAAQQNSLAEALASAIASWNDPDMDGEALIRECTQAALAIGMANGGQQALDGQRAAFEAQKEEALALFARKEGEITAGEAALEQKRGELAAGRAEIEQKRAELAAGEQELGRNEDAVINGIAAAWQEIADGKQELADGEEELQEAEGKYHEKQAEARREIADAYAGLKDIDMAQWYVLDRTSLSSYTNLDTDMTSIGAIGKVFPILFLVVAVLISLTTMTRMVEEERGLIGVYKALGFTDAAIARKYITYALMASALGSALGLCLGFIAMPKMLIAILRAIYVIPNVALHFDLPFAAAGIVIFMASILFATLLACRSELQQTPAGLMRPKTPMAGSRIWLERTPAIWRRFKFLGKVTARNLFRYKKRLLMTVIGIAGCTALVLTGFAIRDSVTDMLPKQYENLSRYDLMVVSDSEDDDKLAQLLDSDENIADYLPVQIENVKAFNPSGDSQSMRMIVVPSGAKLEDYIYTPNREGALTALGTEGVLLTQNAAKLLGLSPGDDMDIQNMQLDRYGVKVQDVIENYLGNHVIISQELYEARSGEYKPNGAYAHFAEGVADQAAYAETLRQQDFVTSSISTQALKDHFSTDFLILNAVIFLLTALAAVLAFAVLFTLSNTNISERARELATIKVLGFYDREVHAYVNKETLILTLIGVIIGLPAGYLLSGGVLSALKMPSLEFVLAIQPASYLLAGVISFGFALIVNLITNRTLDKIDMVEALKSAE